MHHRQMGKAGARGQEQWVGSGVGGKRGGVRQTYLHASTSSAAHHCAQVVQIIQAGKQGIVPPGLVMLRVWGVGWLL